MTESVDPAGFGAVGGVGGPLPSYGSKSSSDISGIKDILKDAAVLPAMLQTPLEKFKDDHDGFIVHLIKNAQDIDNSIEILETDISLKDVMAAKNFNDLVGNILQVPGTPIEAAYTWVAFPMDTILKEFVEIGTSGENAIKFIFGAELAFRAFERMGKLSGLVYKRVAINNLKIKLEAFKKTAKSVEAKGKLEELNNFIEKEEKKLLDESIGYSLQNLFYFPTGMKTVLVLAGQYSGVPAYATGWAFAVAGTAAGSYATYRAYRDIKSYNEFMKLIKEKPIVSEGITFDFKKGKIKISDQARDTLVDGLNKISKKREKYNETRIEKHKVNFEILIKAALMSAHSNNDFDESKQSLIDRAGIDLDHLNITTTEEFEQVVDGKSADYDKLLKQYVDFKESARLTQVRSALKVMAKKKLENVKKFYNFALAKATTALTLSTIILVSAIALKTLAVIGVISLGTIASASTGIGFAVLGAALLLVGLYVLYRYKPHLFKAFLRGVQLQLAFKSIPAFIQQFRQTLKEKKVLEQSLRIQNLSAKFMEFQGKKGDVKIKDKETRNLLKSLKVKVRDGGCDAKEAADKLEIRIKKNFEKWAKLDDELKSLDKKVEKWSAKIKPLQKKLKIARFKDFKKAAKITERSGADYNFHEVIADALMAGGGDLDDDTKEVLEKNIGIEWNKIPRDKKTAMDYLTTFFAMDEAETKNFFDEQLLKFKGV